MSISRDNEGVKSAKRVLEVFEFFLQRQRSATVNDIVQALGYPQSSTSSLLKSLAKMHYLHYDRHQRTYLPTMRIAILGGWLYETMFSGASLSKVVDDLHRESGQSIIIGMQNETFVQYVHVVQPKNPQLPWYLKPGCLRPLCHAAIGRVLLSNKPDVEVLALQRRINAEELDPTMRISAAALFIELARVRELGYAYTEGTVNPGAGVVAMRIPTLPSQPSLAIGIGGAIEEIRKNKDHYLRLLRSALEPYRIVTNDEGHHS
jgi:DNA-binding IclR family transcriptional regulator